MFQYSLFNKYYTPNGLEIDLSNYYTKGEVDNLFQRKLVSGTNIKTINEQSILGSGNISIGGGGGSYTSGDGIDITNDVISVNDTIARVSELPNMNNYYNKDEIDTSFENFYQGMTTALDGKQDVLTTGDGIVLSPSNVISVDNTIARTSDLDDKQDTLVSGTNIKTINNQSLLGSGNIDIGSGTGGNANLNLDITNETAYITNNTESMTFNLVDEKLIVAKPNEYYKEISLGGGSDIFLITKDTTTYQDVLTAFNDNKGLLFRNSAIVDGTSYPVIYALKQTDHVLLYVHNHPQIIDVWKINTDNTYEKTREFVLAENQAIKDYVDGKVATKQDELVSGTNIKSINNQSLLGNGNINIKPNTWGNWIKGQDTTGWNYMYRIDNENMMLECYMNKTLNIGCTATSGNFYRSEPVYINHLKEFSDNLGLGNMEIYDVNINVIKSGYPIFVSLNSINASNPWDLSFYLVSGNSRNATNYNVMVHFISSIETY